MVYFVSTDKSRSRRPRRRNAEINITNLMDVMMVLLVVFMVAAPLMTSGIALNLPKVGGQNLTGKETSLNISVDSDGFIISARRKFRLKKSWPRLWPYDPPILTSAWLFPAIPMLSTDGSSG